MIIKIFFIGNYQTQVDYVLNNLVSAILLQVAFVQQTVHRSVGYDAG